MILAVPPVRFLATMDRIGEWTGIFLGLLGSLRQRVLLGPVPLRRVILVYFPVRADERPAISGRPPPPSPGGSARL